MSNIFRQLGDGGKIFKNEGAFAPEYIPEDIVKRESEIKELAFALRPISENRRPQSIVIYGAPGTGKTCTVKHVLGQLTEYTSRCFSVYLNCWNYPSRFSILSRLAEEVGIFIPRRGVAVDEVRAELVGALKHAKKVPVVVLDEADVVADEEQEIFYDLLRMKENDGIDVGVIAITNRGDVLSQLDDRVRSSLLQSFMEFKRYSPAELKEIVRERARIGLFPGAYTEEVVGMCSGFGAKNGGDARVALNLLWLAGRSAEKDARDEITVDDVEAVKGSVLGSLKKEKIESLDGLDKQIVEIIRGAGEDGIKSGEIYSKVERNERTVRMRLGKLESMGLVEAVFLGGGGGRTRVFKIRK
ncbi:AAA family ATPase [Candidatus Micrarchaeota archaeon]|nr:AAA family ATPase [Candidatus Micrarchaeota archaeon]